MKTEPDLPILVHKSQNLHRLSPNLTPKPNLPKSLEAKNFPLTSRSLGDATSFDRENSPDNRSPTLLTELDISESDDFGKKILQATLERKNLEEQCKLMENRIKKLALEDSKLKTKTKLTKEKTSAILKNRERHLNEVSWIDKYKKEMEQSIL